MFGRSLSEGEGLGVEVVLVDEVAKEEEEGDQRVKW